ncbi:MAG: Acetylpolyamine aminohydrolase [Verrucomicrobia subdivision 3 bacterium]|nr:Acetylpolyamine aminohydrolase [Limisphaerales bacterium]MCS1413773.1 Acetylpolyamine aminohydrolase [Limisphaerales bacterium]
MYVITDERCLNYYSPGHPERPARIKNTLAKLRSQDELEIEWRKPSKPAEDLLKLGHSERHLESLKAPRADFDGDTPAYPQINDHARRAVGGALDALELGLKDQRVLSLMRPPGHHATRERAMGFCYLGSVGISVLHAAKNLGKRVAVFDFDVHHGNGTEALLLNQKNVAFFSIHQHPCYPGTGVTDVGDNCFNFPVAPRTPRKDYREILSRAFEALIQWRLDLIAVSAGFDAYARDPIAQETLEADDFHWLGREISKQGIPFYSVLEGGYSNDLPELVDAYLQGTAA